MNVNFNILNQLGSPSLNSNTFANRPAAGQTGRLFISTDTREIYRDTGSGWDLVGTGTGGGISGSGAANQVTYWTGTSAVGGESSFTYNPTTNALRVDGNISAQTNASAWTVYNVLQIYQGAFGSAGVSSIMTANTFFDGNWKYINSDYATSYTQNAGEHFFRTSQVSGTAGNNISWIIGMHLNASSNLGVNTSPSAWRTNYQVVELPFGSALYSQSVAQRTGISSNAYQNNSSNWIYSTTNTAQYFEMNAGAFSWNTAASGTIGNTITFNNVMSIDTTGNLLLSGTTTATLNLAGYKSIEIFNPGNCIIGSTTGSPINYSSNANYYSGQWRRFSTGTSALYSMSAGEHQFSMVGSGAAGSTISWLRPFTITSASNVLIGTTTDGGSKFQVNGDSVLTGSGATNATTGLTVRDSASTILYRVRNDGATFYGSQTLAAISPMNTTTFSVDKAGEGMIFSMNSTNIGTLLVVGGTDNANTSGTVNIFNVKKGFSPPSGTGTYVNTLINPVINQTGGASGITRGLVVNPTLTSAADWRSIEILNNSGWGIYQSGASADNYLNGNTLIGTSTDSGFKLDVNGSTRLNGTVRIDGQLAATAGGASGQHLTINCGGTIYKIALLNN